ncbi:unnamed protein product [Discula destructiva]
MAPQDKKQSNSDRQSNQGAASSREQRSSSRQRMVSKNHHRTSNSNDGPQAPCYDYVDYFDGVDKMMRDAREAEAKAKLPAAPEQPPPPDYETIEYFARMDAMMARINNGTIENEDEPARKRHGSVSKAIGYVKSLWHRHEPPSNKK